MEAFRNEHMPEAVRRRAEMPDEFLDVYRDLAYVKAECEGLVAQLFAMRDGPPIRRRTGRRRARRMRALAYSEFHPSVWRTWSAWEALRRCGFSADDIYVGMGIDGRRDAVYVQLLAQGKEFNLVVGTTPLSEDDFIAEWQSFCARLNAGDAGSKDEMHAVYLREMNAWGGAVALVLAIRRKGIEIHWPDLADEGDEPIINAITAGGLH